MRRVAERADVDEPAVWSWLLNERIAIRTAINRWRLHTVGRGSNSWRLRQTVQAPLNRRHETAGEATDRALQMEVIVGAVVSGADIAECHVGGICTGEKRIGRQTVAIDERRQPPIGDRRPSQPLPERHLSRAAGLQHIVVADETDLAVVVHRNVVAAGLSPQDVVAQLHEVRRTLHSDRVAGRLIHGVIDHRRPTIRISASAR